MKTKNIAASRKKVRSKIKSDTEPIQKIKNDIAVRLLKGWMDDNSGYDEKKWKTIKNAIEQNKLSIRSRFSA